MRHLISLFLSTGTLAACALTSPQQAVCPSPGFSARNLVVGDGALDRGFPGGVSLADVDGDGDLDVMATRGYDTTEQNRPFRFDRSMLYINDGAGNFSHAADSPLANADSPASGSTWGDIDHDGDIDAFVSTQHGRPDVFYRNLGGGRMAREDLGEATSAPGSNFTSGWVDMDGDGDLDLMSGGPALEPGQPNLVFRNDDGAFVRVSNAAIENGVGNPGAVLWADVDNDGDQDLFVANSDISRRSSLDPATYETSQLYRNDGAWRFVRTEGQGFDDPLYPALGAAFGDIDGDGDLDLFLAMQPGVPDRSFADRIFRNDGRGHFVLDATFAGPLHNEMAGGATFADFDLDGDLDLLFGNFNTGIYLYTNDGAGGFTPVADAALNARVNSHGGFASGDIDNDGDHDVVVGNWGDTHEGEYVTILRNETVACGRSLRIELRDRYGAVDPIGARVTLVTRGVAGERRQVREAMGQTGFRAQSASSFLYGLPAGERVVQLVVRWPSGQSQTIARLGRDGLTVVREGSP